MTVTILIGDVREKLAELPDESVHCVVTSPPYWGLRCYGVDGQIGQEPTLGEHISTMVAIFREIRRVLRKDGTCWLNYGDCYAAAPNGRSADAVKALGNDDRTFRDKPFSTVGPVCDSDYRKRTTGGIHAERREDSGSRIVAGGFLKPKDLCMIPARLAIALQDDGWWVRSEIIWAKPNPMPESVQDRPTSAHEKIYLLTKSQRYYYDAEAVRTPSNGYDKMPDGWDTGAGGHGSFHRQGREKGKRADKQRGHGRRHAGFNDRWDAMNKAEQCQGANLRNVWNIATQPFSDAHFATFPPNLIEPCIKAGTSERGCCAECGAPWVREMDREFIGDRTKDRGLHVPDGINMRISAGSGGHNRGNHRHIGWSPSCACDTETVACTALDPFFGSGTTGLVADRLGRDCIGIELNPEYAAMARKRIDQDAATRGQGPDEMMRGDDLPLFA